MNRFVTITANTAGVVVMPTKNPEVSQVRVEETRISYENGFRTSKKRTALINGHPDDLVKEFALGQKVPGQVVIIESLVPFRKEDSEKDMKKAGDTAVVCRVDDQPIYRSTVFTADQDTPDTLIAHTNSDEIKATQAVAPVAPVVIGAALDTAA